MKTPFHVHRNQSAARASAFDPWLHASPIRGNRRGTENSKAKRNALREPQSQRSVSSDQLAENEQPRMYQKTAVLSYLAEIVNPKAIYFLPSMMVIELALNDGRSYKTHSLPGTVAGRTTLYHHSETPFLHSTKDLHRERRLDPAKSEFLGRCQRIAQTTFSSSLLTPGVRLSSGRGAKGTI